MGKRADRARAKAEALADDVVEGARSGAHSVVDGAEEVFGKAKRQTKKARKAVDEVADKAEARVAAEEGKRKRLAAGELGLDIYDMRRRLAEKGLKYV